MYGKTVTIELDHSDIDLNELMEIFKGLTIASGFEVSSWNSVIKDLSAEIHDYEREDLKEKLNEWKNEDECDECNDEYKDLRHSFGSWTADTDMGEDYDGQFKDWENETPIEENVNDMRKVVDSYDDLQDQIEREAERRMDIIGQNGNEGTHYSFEWDNEYENESNDILNNINDSITLIKDRMEDIDMRMDNIDEQLDILNADVANIEFNIQHPIKEKLIEAVARYNEEVKEKHQPVKFAKDVVDMESGEVTYDNDGGFDGKAIFAPYAKKPNQKVTEKKMNKSVVKKGKIKDLKK
jgi:hypothetical protein